VNFTSFLSFFNQHTAHSSHAVDAHQMYSVGSVVGKEKASAVGIEILPTLHWFSQAVK